MVPALSVARLLPQGAAPPLRLREVRDGALTARDGRALAAVRTGGAALLLAGHGWNRLTTSASRGDMSSLALLLPRLVRGGLLAGHGAQPQEIAPPSSH